MTKPLAAVLLALLTVSGVAAAADNRSPAPPPASAPAEVVQAPEQAGATLIAGIVSPAGQSKKTPAAKVVVLSGAATAVDRAGERRPLASSALVYPGDTLFTAEGARVQLRFTDGALMSLRAGTQFRIDEYRYGGNPGSQERAFFSLLKGGLRTITGIIGVRKREDYEVQTPVATIGKRGTHYALYLCQASACADDPDTQADGLYGAVLEGAVAASNDAGVKVFTTDQYFHVPGRDATPELLFRPPAVLFGADPLARDTKGERRLPSESLAKREPAQVPQVPVRSLPETSQNASGGGLVFASLIAPEPVFQTGEVVQAVVGESYGLPEDSSPVGGQAAEPAPDIPSGPVAMVSFLQSRNSAQILSSGGGLQEDQVARGTVGAFHDMLTGFDLTHNFNGDSHSCERCTFNAGTGSLADSGEELTPSYQINWGRWEGDFTMTEGANGPLVTVLQDVHFVQSDDLTSSAQLAVVRNGLLSNTGSAVATFSYLGGPRPTAYDAKAGTSSLGEITDASVQIDFAGSTGPEVTGYALNLTAGGEFWSASFDGAIPIGEARSGNITLSGHCDGCKHADSRVGADGRASLQLIGPEAQRAISAFGLQTTDNHRGVSGAMVLQRP